MATMLWHAPFLTGNTPLLIAAAKGYIDIIYHINKTFRHPGKESNELGENVFLLAIKYGHIALVKCIIQDNLLHFANYSPKDKQGNDHYMTAAKYNRLEMIHEFENQEVSISIKHHNFNENNEGENAACIAAKNGFIQFLDALVKEAGANLDRWSDRSGKSPLICAASTGQTEKVKVLSEK